MTQLKVSVVSAEREIWSGEAVQLSAKTVLGEIGILPGHEPMLALLAHGRVKIKSTTNETIQVDATDGFFSVDQDNVTVVAGQAALVA